MKLETAVSCNVASWLVLGALLPCSECWDPERPSCLDCHLCGWWIRTIVYVYTVSALPHKTSPQPGMMTSNAVVTDEKGAFMCKVISRVKLSLIFLSTVLSLSKVNLFWIWRLLYEREIIKKKKVPLY